jgi:FMN-dependent NADH-azoreductase
MRVLHLIATPRADGCQALAVSEVLLATMASQDPGLVVDELDVHAGAGLDTASAGSLAWPSRNELVRRFQAADSYVLACPTWDGGLPPVLARLIDGIVGPGRRMRPRHRVVRLGRLRDRQLVVVTCPGDATEGVPAGVSDLRGPEVRTALASVGITEIGVICAQPIDEAARRRVQMMATAVDGAPAHHWPAMPAGEPRPPRARAC